MDWESGRFHRYQEPQHKHSLGRTLNSLTHLWASPGEAKTQANLKNLVKGGLGFSGNYTSVTPISISSDGSVLWEAVSLLGPLGKTTEEWGGRHDGGRRTGRWPPVAQHSKRQFYWDARIMLSS